jgi:2-methylcitrate dehydratase PrpD
MQIAARWKRFLLIVLQNALQSRSTPSIRAFPDAFVRRPDVQELMRKAAIVTNENYDPEVSGASVWDQVTVELANRERIESEKVRRARGHAERPLGEGELFDKFRTCFDAGHARLSPEVLFDRLRRLETISARELTAIA